MREFTVLNTVGEVALKVGRSASTVRLWASRGLLPVAAKTDGGQRLFDPRAVERLIAARRDRLPLWALERADRDKTGTGRRR